MRGKRWPSSEAVLLRQLMEAGHSYRSAAIALGRTYSQVRSKCRKEGWRSKATSTGKLEFVEAPPDIPAYDGALCLPGDLGGGLMIAADIHAPCTDWKMATRVALVGQRYLEEPRRLVIAGDLMNYDVFSRYENLLPLPTIKQEIDAAKFAIQLWLNTFDRIYLVLGNHDYRWLKAMHGVFEEELLIDMLGMMLGNEERLTINLYSYLDIECERTGSWRVTHMPRYSKIPLSKARSLSNVTKDRHLMLAHQHHASIALDESGHFLLVDIPALVDPEKLAYVALADTDIPRMKCGFVMLKNGWPYLFAEGMTDWSFWLDGAQ